MPTIMLPAIEEGSIDIGGERLPVVNHRVVVPLSVVGTVLRQNEGAELVPETEE